MGLQRVERCIAYDAPVHCCFCGQLVVDTGDDREEAHVDPCPHTLFIAHDAGYEFVAQRAETSLLAKGYRVLRHDSGEIEIDHQDPEAPDSPDGITDTIDVSDGLKIASYVPAPSFFGSYVGFAPADD